MTMFGQCYNLLNNKCNYEVGLYCGELQDIELTDPGNRLNGASCTI